MEEEKPPVNIYSWHVNEKGQEVASPYIIFDPKLHKKFMKDQDAYLYPETVRYYKTKFIHDEKLFVAKAREWMFKTDHKFDFECYEVQNTKLQLVAESLNTIYSLQDVSTTIRYNLSAKGKRIKWEASDKDQWESLISADERILEHVFN